MANQSYSKLKPSNASFDSMLRRFGVVTVMNAKVYEVSSEDFSKKKADEILKLYNPEKAIATLDTLKIANVTVEGPDKTVTGGQYNNPLIKFGKTARLEMQDALGNADAIEAFGGGFVEHYGAKDSHTDHATTSLDVLHIDEGFAGPKTIIGDSFFIDQKTGLQVPVTIIFYQFLPDSIFNLTQDAEGDATVFDLNGDLLTTNILVGTDATAANNIVHGVFYSIMPKEGPAPLQVEE